MQDQSRQNRSSRFFDNRQNKQPQPRSSYLKHFQEKEKQKNQMQIILKKNDINIQNILNSSLDHLDKAIQSINTPLESLSKQQIAHQNAFLKDNLNKMKKILKDKLETGLQKQRQQLNQVIGEYVSFISKLLQDKEELTRGLHQNQLSNGKQQQYLSQIQILKNNNRKMKYQLAKKDNQIAIDQQKLDQFLIAIQKYEEDDLKQQQRMEGMILRIQQLQARNKIQKPLIMQTSFTEKKDSDKMKIQRLLQLLKSKEEENNQLKQIIQNLQRQKQQLKDSLEQKIQAIQKQNEEGFIEYEKAVNQTLQKKDDCIQRLNGVLENLKKR